jgi:queuine tRNA-ribosyltransferase catalytic subunit
VSSLYSNKHIRIVVLCYTLLWLVDLPGFGFACVRVRRTTMASSQPDATTTTRKRPLETPAIPEEQNAVSAATPSSSCLSDELNTKDFSQRVCWDKFYPYTDKSLPIVVDPETPPVFTNESPALCHYINAISGRARATTIHLLPQPGQVKKNERSNKIATKTTPVQTPIFMPVGTKGCLKGLEIAELTSDPALACPIILANTYHLAIQPGTELIDQLGGLHSFQGLPNTDTEFSYNLLTDSGGFQMVSLVKLSEITEQGVSFENPFHSKSCHNSSSNDGSVSVKKKDMLLLTPEDSIRHQNNIGANIIMALDDVVSSVAEDEERFRVATHRTLRWYDRCYQAHGKPECQNLFPIVQGALDTELGGLREQCLAGFRHRAENLGYSIPGYAIGGLAGGESKDSFWRVVDQCCRALPDTKPRYLMGVGYPLDLVVCTALGVDMYDCVYPTRTARFGVALIPGPSPGTLRIKSQEFATDMSVIQADCQCQACREGISRARLNALLKTSNALAVELVTQHNIAYMMALVRSMRQAILEDRYAEYVQTFIKDHFPTKSNDEAAAGAAGGKSSCPSWVVDALAAAGIQITP